MSSVPEEQDLNSSNTSNPEVDAKSRKPASDGNEIDNHEDSPTEQIESVPKVDALQKQPVIQTTVEDLQLIRSAWSTEKVPSPSTSSGPHRRRNRPRHSSNTTGGAGRLERKTNYFKLTKKVKTKRF